MPILDDMNGCALLPGCVVWCENAAGFPGEVMLAEVLDCPTGDGVVSIAATTARASECVWVRQLPTPAVPIPQEKDAWVTRWPAAKTMVMKARTIGRRKLDSSPSPIPA